MNYRRGYFNGWTAKEFKCSWCGKYDCGLPRCPRKGMLYRIWDDAKRWWYVILILLYIPGGKKVKCPACGKHGHILCNQIEQYSEWEKELK